MNKIELACDTSFKLRIFIAHGRNIEQRDRLIRLIEDQFGENFEPVCFQGAQIHGDATFETFERISVTCDAAIILATPDDFGRNENDEAETPRARENVWMELGWFWARLGRHRTLLLVHDDVDIPSNFEGILPARYVQDVGEAVNSLHRFLTPLESMEADDLTEIVYLSSTVSDRERQWMEICQSAEKRLVITGVAMGAVRYALHGIFDRIDNGLLDELILIVVDPEFCRRSSDLFEFHYRPNCVRDNRNFFFDLKKTLSSYKRARERVTTILYPEMPTFAAVVADGPSLGSSMVVQPFVLKPSKSPLNHPRFRLRRRTSHGVYMTYWAAVEELANASSEVLHGLEGLTLLEKRLL